MTKTFGLSHVAQDNETRHRIEKISFKFDIVNNSGNNPGQPGTGRKSYVGPLKYREKLRLYD